MRVCIAVVVAACSSPAPPPPAGPVSAPAKPVETALVRTWIVSEHVLVKGASITAEDAAGFHGRTLDITASGFMSPWQGTCDRASRTEQRRTVGEVVAELGVIAEDRAKVEAFGFAEPATEYRLACDDRAGAKRIPLTILVGGDKAMTCYGGACYLLSRF